MAKVTVEEFSKKLSSKYKTGAAARKAIGRFNGWTDKEKAQGRALVAAHFGQDGTEPAPEVKEKFNAGMPDFSLLKSYSEPAAQLTEQDKLAEQKRLAEKLIEHCAIAANTLQVIGGVCPSLNILPYARELVEMHNGVIRFFSSTLASYVSQERTRTFGEEEVDAAEEVDLASGGGADDADEEDTFEETPKAKRRSRKNGKSTDLSL